MNTKIKEALIYLILSMVFFAISIPIIFEVVMYVMHILFVIIGALFLIPAYLMIDDYFRTPKK